MWNFVLWAPANILPTLRSFCRVSESWIVYECKKWWGNKILGKLISVSPICLIKIPVLPNWVLLGISKEIMCQASQVMCYLYPHQRYYLYHHHLYHYLYHSKLGLEIVIQMYSIIEIIGTPKSYCKYKPNLMDANFMFMN